MFVQVIRGAVTSEREALEMFDRWMEDLRPGATGWLGTTAGITATGELIILARFASEEEARSNSERREQSAWWEEMEKRFSGRVTFHDCADVAVFLDGGDDDAGFVQIMQGRGDGSFTAADIAARTEEAVRQYRPDVLGGLAAIADDGTVFEAVYFTSEAEAREAEAQPLPPEVSEDMERFMGSFEDLTYHDLSQPRMAS